jgi:hypothetical protein
MREPGIGQAGPPILERMMDTVHVPRKVKLFESIMVITVKPDNIFVSLDKSGNPEYDQVYGGHISSSLKPK